MAAEATFIRCHDDRRLVVDTAPTAQCEIWQLADGRAAYLSALNASTNLAANDLAAAMVEGIVEVPKTTSMVFLDGGPVYWDHSANKAHFKKVSDRDFFLGTAYGDHLTAAATTMKVNLNVQPRFDIQLDRDGFQSVLVGTAAAGGFGYPVNLGGALVFELTATNEAQKVDALSVDGFAVGANPIIRGIARVLSDGGTGSQDISLGLASATHASDADTIAESIFIHLDGNVTTINAECDDGTNETAATTTATTYTEGTALASRFEFWIDCRSLSSIKFYVEGARVASGTTFSVAAAAGPWFLLVHVEKASGTDVYKLAIDHLSARFMQQDTGQS